MPTGFNNDYRKITVAECFGETMQGEGALAGCVTAFVRTGGCDFTCFWCLGPNTPIVLATGKRKKIKDIVVGDILVGYDEKTGTLQETIVTATLAHEVEELYTLETGNTEKSKQKVVCSGDHMWMTRDRGWVQTRDLTTEDIILSSHDYALNSWRMRSNNPMQKDSVVARVRMSQKKLWTPEKRDVQRAKQKLIPSHREKMLGDKNPMRNPETVVKQVASRNWKPSSYELRAERLVEYYGLPFKLCNMDTPVFIPQTGRYRYPDMIIPGTRKVVEIYDPTYKGINEEFERGQSGYAEKAVSDYASAGYQALPLKVRPGITDHEITQQLSVFALNGLQVKSVKPLPAKARGAMSKSYEDGVLKMHDIKCEPYPTFFANGMLTHNCDSLHAVLPKFAKTWKKYTTDELVAEVSKIAPRGVTITLSGGNPALQPFGGFIIAMQSRGNPVVIETQGSKYAEWFQLLDHVVLSPKPPSSGMTTDWDALDLCARSNRSTSIKVVVMNEDDFEYARQVYRRYLDLPFYISVGNPNPPIQDENHVYGQPEFSHADIVRQTEWLIHKIAHTEWEGKMPRVLPQTHTLLWGNKPGV